MFLLLLADEYFSVKAGYSRLTRELSDDFKAQGIEKENKHDNGIVSVHVGYFKTFKYIFLGAEGFGNMILTGQKTYFEQDLSAGLKAFLQNSMRWSSMIALCNMRGCRHFL